MITDSSCFTYLDQKGCIFKSCNCYTKSWLKFHLLYRHCSPCLSMLFAACSLTSSAIPSCTHKKLLNFRMTFASQLPNICVLCTKKYNSLNHNKYPRILRDHRHLDLTRSRQWISVQYCSSICFAINSSEDNWSIVLILNQRANIPLWLPLWSSS